MSKYTFLNEETGDTVTFEWYGDSEPTDQDLEEIFDEFNKQKSQEQEQPKLPEQKSTITETQELTPEIISNAPQTFIPPQSTIEGTIRGNRFPEATILPGEQSDVGTAPYQEIRQTPIPANAPSQILTEPTIFMPENQGDVGTGQYQTPDVFLPETEFQEGQAPEAIVPEGTIPTREPLPDIPASSGIVGIVDALPGLEMTGSDVDELKKKYGKEYVAGNIISNLGLSVIGGAGMGALLKGSIQNPFLLQALTRVGTALTVRILKKDVLNDVFQKILDATQQLYFGFRVLTDTGSILMSPDKKQTPKPIPGFGFYS